MTGDWGLTSGLPADSPRTLQLTLPPRTTTPRDYGSSGVPHPPHSTEEMYSDMYQTDRAGGGSGGGMSGGGDTRALLSSSVDIHDLEQERVRGDPSR